MKILFLLTLMSFALLMMAIACKPTRKALGVVLCFLGLLECLSGIGLIIGVPSIFFGAVLLFC